MDSTHNKRRGRPPKAQHESSTADKPLDSGSVSKLLESLVQHLSPIRPQSMHLHRAIRCINDAHRHITKQIEYEKERDGK